MRFLALLLLTGCIRPATRVTVTIPAPEMLDRAGCDLDAHHINYWLGDDGMIGFGLTCEQAFQDWRTTRNPVERVQL
jgi:hypothetical protein